MAPGGRRGGTLGAGRTRAGPGSLDLQSYCAPQDSDSHRLGKKVMCTRDHRRCFQSPSGQKPLPCPLNKIQPLIFPVNKFQCLGNFSPLGKDGRATQSQGGCGSFWTPEPPSSQVPRLGGLGSPHGLVVSCPAPRRPPTPRKNRPECGSHPGTSSSKCCFK